MDFREKALHERYEVMINASRETPRRQETREMNDVSFTFDRSPSPILQRNESFQAKEQPSNRLWETSEAVAGPSKPTPAPIRYMSEGYVPPARATYMPTTADILQAHDRTQYAHDNEEVEFLPYPASRKSAPVAVAQTKRQRPLSPMTEGPARPHIVQSISASDYSPLEGDITPEMAITFERQVQRMPHGITAADAIVGRARNNLHTRLMADRNQRFVAPEIAEDWWNYVTTTTLAAMIMKYYGPQSPTGNTVEQAMMALPFGFDYNDRTLEDNTINSHIELLETHCRSHGPLSAAQEEALSLIIEKRITRSAALYADFKESKRIDKEKRIPETWRRALQRWATCIQAVRDVIALGTKYGSTDKATYHTYNSGETDPEVTGHVGTTTSTASKVGSVAAKAIAKVNADFTAVIPPKANTYITTEKQIKKRPPPEEVDVYITTPSTCRVCGHSEHVTQDCTHKDNVDANKCTSLTWAESAIGKVWAKCGHTKLHLTQDLPNIPATIEARKERNPKDNSNNNGDKKRGGYLGSKPDNRCKVSHHVMAALNNITANPDFVSAKIFLLQQMSRRGATTMPKDPLEAPSDSVDGQVLLDTGSLAGDFISPDFLLRLKGEHQVYRTAQSLTVCSGLDGTCYTSSDMLDIAILIITPKGTPKIIRLSVRINPSSSCDLIIGRKSLKKHNFYALCPSHFQDKEDDPAIGPFDELRWINDTTRRLRKKDKLPSSEHTVDPAPPLPPNSPTPPEPPRPPLPATPTVPPGTVLPQVLQAQAEASSVGNPLPCTCQGPHCLITSDPTTATTATRKLYNNLKRKRKAATRAAQQYASLTLTRTDDRGSHDSSSDCAR